jgi:hypothetical protein
VLGPREIAPKARSGRGTTGARPWMERGLGLGGVPATCLRGRQSDPATHAVASRPEFYEIDARGPDQHHYGASERGDAVNGRVVRTRNIETCRSLGNWYQAAAPSALAHMAHFPKRTAPVSVAQSPLHASLSLEPNVLTRRH